MKPISAEEKRLQEDVARSHNWKRWGPYLSERQWATVREDYSLDGSVWEYFPHDHARSRAYRWGEDGLCGMTDRECRLCFSLALWNGQDRILKERLFGLTGPQGNHGEDVKESYFYLDSTPTHSYMKMLYKYPQKEFPYQRLIEENRNRGLDQREFELVDTGIWNDDAYFDIFTEYAKASPNDILIKITAHNRAHLDAPLYLIPQLWFRNTWSWGCSHDGCWMKPRIIRDGANEIVTDHESLGQFRFAVDVASNGAKPNLVFTENESNFKALFGTPNLGQYTRDAFHDYVVAGRKEAVNPKEFGSKVGAIYVLAVPAGGSVTVRARLVADNERPVHLFDTGFEDTFTARIQEANDFYSEKIPAHLDADQKSVMRQAYAGLLWSKQFYHYTVKEWLYGDPDQPAPPASRLQGRNSEWQHLFNRDIISMPDKWEYPWYASWDLAFHMVPFARIDTNFPKEQLQLLLREWYMHPNGQIPAYEFAFSDVNPPVHAWACWRVFKMTAPKGQRDTMFLKRVFQKLLMNFTWWVNQKDPHGRHLFSGGFLGLDNIGVFDRSKPLPTGGHLEQADGTAWMAFYCMTMLAISLELALEDPSYEDMASKFFEHFVAISDAMNTFGGTGLWDEQEGFYYDQIRFGDRVVPQRVRSLVGLIPLIAVYALEPEMLERLPGFSKRMQWFIEHRGDLKKQNSIMSPREGARDGMRLLSIPNRERLMRVLRYMLDETEFLSPFGIRSLSKVHKDRPFTFHVNGETHRVEYLPGESNSRIFGGNSNWRGPVWFPTNYLLIEALERYHFFYGDTLKVECPVGSGTMLNLKRVAVEISRRLSALFLTRADGTRPVHGDDKRFAESPHWRDLPLFYEYFHGDTGRGLGAEHQTGWTALVTELLRSNPGYTAR